MYDLAADSPRYDVIVVGAGLAGLSAARELIRREPSLKVIRKLQVSCLCTQALSFSDQFSIYNYRF
ncbi:unnamed protein product [Strongylus vulgaris]|uniref:FAD-dependent oxidoreductase 2 FAD-binding domain-containing protein n=1 Tax=Strongylus vulgaris TaxID=40348 RepID=A0A3P7KP51_STRVU|nr:unnamed protein product [Strongylus vulgaris]